MHDWLEISIVRIWYSIYFYIRKNGQNDHILKLNQD